MYMIEDKMLGCLYGQEIGDALGLGSEFMSKEEVIKNYPEGLKTYGQIIQDALYADGLKVRGQMTQT